MMLRALVIHGNDDFLLIFHYPNDFIEVGTFELRVEQSSALDG